MCSNLSERNKNLYKNYLILFQKFKCYQSFSFTFVLIMASVSVWRPWRSVHLDHGGGQLSNTLCGCRAPVGSNSLSGIWCNWMCHHLLFLFQLFFLVSLLLLLSLMQPLSPLSSWCLIELLGSRQPYFWHTPPTYQCQCPWISCGKFYI